MKNVRTIVSLFYVIPAILILLCPTATRPETTQKRIKKGPTQGPIVIKSNTFEIDNKNNMVTFTGDVDAKRDDFTVNCQKMILYYHRGPDNKGYGNEGAAIDRIIATGQVKIRQSGGGLATAEKAIYYQNDDKMVLTGNPVVKQGDDFVEGSTITLYIKDNRSVVKGSDKNKARAVLFH